MKFTLLDTKRTNNFNDPDIQRKIMSLWEKNTADIEIFMKEGLKIACIYHNYESNYKGDYSVSICKEDNINGLLDTSKYTWKEYKVDTKDELGVINTWRSIWSDEENEKIQRVYTFDFEQYSPNGDISIFVAVN